MTGEDIIKGMYVEDLLKPLKKRDRQRVLDIVAGVYDITENEMEACKEGAKEIERIMMKGPGRKGPGRKGGMSR